MGRALVVGAMLVTGCVSYVPRPIDVRADAVALTSRTLDDAALRTYAERSLGRTFETWPPAKWDLDTLTAAAFYDNANLAVARAEHATALAAMGTAAERPNPTLSASIENKPSGNEPPWVTTFGFDFPLELPAKRRARNAQARELAAASFARIGSAAWDVRAALRNALLELRAANERADALRAEEATEADIVELFAKRVELGEAARPELTRARIARMQVTQLVADQRRRAAESRASLAAALGLPARALANAPIDTTVRVGDVREELRDAALTSRPDVVAALHEYAAADAALRLEVARQYPDVHIAPGLGWDQGTRTWSLGASAELPLLNRHRGPIAEASARREEAAARVLALQSSIVAAFDAARIGVDAAREKLASVDELLRDSETQAASVRKQFEAGELDRLAIRSAELEVEAARLARIDAEVELRQALGAVEDAMQRPLAGALPEVRP